VCCFFVRSSNLQVVRSSNLQVMTWMLEVDYHDARLTRPSHIRRRFRGIVQSGTRMRAGTSRGGCSPGDADDEAACAERRERGEPAEASERAHVVAS
jgi:hypothetical protein